MAHARSMTLTPTKFVGVKGNVEDENITMHLFIFSESVTSARSRALLQFVTST